MIDDALTIHAVPGGFRACYPDGETWEQRWRRLRSERAERYRAMGLSEKAIARFVGDPALGRYFERVCAA